MVEEKEAIERLYNMKNKVDVALMNSKYEKGNWLYDDVQGTSDTLIMAINALEKQGKIKEAFEMWKAETGGYYGADDETTRFISTLNQILRSDEE